MNNNNFYKIKYYKYKKKYTELMAKIGGSINLNMNGIFERVIVS